MIKFINYVNEDLERQFELDIKNYYQEVRQFLPALPKDMQIYFMSPERTTYGMSTGGYAYSPQIISLAIDPQVKRLDNIRDDLRSTLFHEAFHIVHNYTGQTGPFSLLECALQEGSATVFERQYVDGKPKDLYGNYKQHPSLLLNQWLDTIKMAGIVSDDYYSSIAFYDKSDNTSWKLYKTGTWLVDKYIKKNKKDIKDLTNEDLAKIANNIQ